MEAQADAGDIAAAVAAQDADAIRLEFFQLQRENERRMGQLIGLIGAQADQTAANVRALSNTVDTLARDRPDAAAPGAGGAGYQRDFWVNEPPTHPETIDIPREFEMETVRDAFGEPEINADGSVQTRPRLDEDERIRDTART